MRSRELWHISSLSNRAQAAIGTLIIFISLLIIAAVAAGVLIQSTGSFQESALTTGNKVRDDVSGGFSIIDVTGSEGSSGVINYITMITKLPPGTPPINLDYVTLVIGTKNVTSTLKYRGSSGTTLNDNTGYNTWLPEELGVMASYHELIDQDIGQTPQINLDLDMDLDGLVDTIVVCRDGRNFCEAGMGYDGTHVMINLSSAGRIYVPIYDQNGGPINLVNKADGESIKTTLEEVSTYGYLTAVGSEGAGGYVIPANTIHLFLPYITLAEDLDDDGSADLMVVNDTHVILFASSEGNTTEQFNLTAGHAYSLGFNLSDGAQAVSAEITMNDNDSTTKFGSVSISGTTTRASYIDEDVSFVVTPYKIYQGYFSTEYVQTGPNNVAGIMKNGDVVRFYVEAPRDLHEDELLRITLLPKSGVQTLAEFYMPNIISKSYVHMYP